MERFRRLSPRARDLIELESIRTERLIASFRVAILAVFLVTDFAALQVGSSALGFETPKQAIALDGLFVVAAVTIRLWLRNARSHAKTKYGLIALDYAYVASYSFLFRESFGSGDVLTGMVVSVVPLMILLSALRFSVIATSYSVLIGTFLSVGVACVSHANWGTIGYAVVMPALTGSLAVYISHRHRLSIDRALERNRFERFLPKQVVDQVISGAEDVELGGREVEVSVLFTDVVGFTTLCERVPPLEILSLLNEFFSAVATVVFRHFGMLDKFIGDAAMAVFGAPLAHPDDAERAVRCALDIRDAIANLNSIRITDSQPPIEFGIAIHTGRVVAGTLGSPERMEYTVIGDSVNVAARVEGLTRQLNRRILITRATADRAGDSFDIEPMGSFSVKGRKEPVEVFAVHGYKARDATPPLASA